MLKSLRNKTAIALTVTAGLLVAGGAIAQQKTMAIGTGGTG